METKSETRARDFSTLAEVLAAARESSQFLLWKIFSRHGSTRAYSKDFEELKREALERVSLTRLTYYIEREKRTKE
jgi:hypothetical protein